MDDKIISSMELSASGRKTATGGKHAYNRRGICRFLAGCIVCLLYSAAAVGGDTIVPAQWVAKQYTEMLGRAPSPTEWSQHETSFISTSTSCDATALETLGRSVATSPEFLALYPDTSPLLRAARASALVRATLSHEVNTGDWSNFVDSYATGQKTWPQTLDVMYNWPNFQTRTTNEFCNSQKPNYGFGYVFFPTAPVDLHAKYSATTSRTQVQLQNVLDATLPGGVVELYPGETITIGTQGGANQGLQIPAGVTLRTAGYFPGAYASYGRLEAATGSVFCTWIICTRSAVVKLAVGARLEGIWIDGRDISTASTKMALVEVAGSDASNPSAVVSTRLSGITPTGVGIRAVGQSVSGNTCSNLTISSNLITGYDTLDETSFFGEVQNADGIQVFCENAQLSSNQLVDLTGVAMSFHGSVNRASGLIKTQSSEATFNTIFNAGLNGVSGIAFEPIGECWPENGWVTGCVDLPFRSIYGTPETLPFQGASASNNFLFSGPSVHFDIGVILGGDPRWGDHRVYGEGASVTSLSSGPASLRANIGVAVAGMINATVGVADLDVKLVPGNPNEIYGLCPQKKFVVSSASSSTISNDVAFEIDDTTSSCALMTAAEGIDALELDPSGSDALVGKVFQQEFKIWALRTPPGNISEHWHDMDDIAENFREVRLLGANATRLKLQFHTIIDAPSSGFPNGTPNALALSKLKAVVDLAQRHGMYVIISGLRLGSDGDNNDWYALRSESGRWASQRVFWSEVAKTLKNHPAIAYFDLMNEPIAPGGPASTWCVGSDPHCFAQVLTKDPAGRTRLQIAQEWLQAVIPGIRVDAGDIDRLIGVGMFQIRNSNGVNTVAGSGFTYPEIYPTLNAVAGPRSHVGTVHIYPTSDNPDTAVDELQLEIDSTLNYKVANAPLIVDEIFPLNNFSSDVTFDFMERVQPSVTGFVGQYMDVAPLENTPFGSTLPEILGRSASYQYGARWLSSSWLQTGAKVGATLP